MAAEREVRIRIEDEVVLCGDCGTERRWTVGDCKLCGVVARNVALEEEVREVRVLLSEARQQLQEAKQDLLELRGKGSVRSQSGESPRGWGVSGWRAVGRGGKGRESTPLCEVECGNRFKVLDTQEEEEVVIEIGAGEGGRTPEAKVVKGKAGEMGRKDKVRKEESQEVLVLGDSRIRYLDRTFCDANKGKRMTCCLPGAGVQDVVEKFKRVVKGTGKEAIVVVHVGVNDVCKKGLGSEELVRRYKELLREIKESGRRCIVSGVLPRQKVGGKWLSHALGLNDRLRRMCGEWKVGFMDEWDRFYGRQELYAMDGIHFSRKGVSELSECLERVVRQYSQGN